MAVKELNGEKRWVTRYVSTYCPRLFSAIRLPGETLESRSIIIPLVRSSDQQKANSEVLNPKHWPTARETLIDDLWALALANLHNLPAYEDVINEETTIAGRLLEPWRPILTVAKWLQDQGVDDLYTRLHTLSITYQTEKKTIVKEDFASVVIEALHNLHNLPNLHNLYGGITSKDINIKEVVQQVMRSAEPSDSETEDEENAEKTRRSLSTRVGIVLRQLRFQRLGQEKHGDPVKWRIVCNILHKCIASHGLTHLLPQEGYAGYAGGCPWDADPKNADPLPPDPHKEGYEVMQVMKVMHDEPTDAARQGRQERPDDAPSTHNTSGKGSWTYPRRGGLS